MQLQSKRRQGAKKIPKIIVDSCEAGPAQK
jgi:hypothetical protein